jgi:hypothetical protein
VPTTTAPRPRFKRVPNPFADLPRPDHQKAIEAGVISAARRIGRDQFSKASYSRVFSGAFQLVSPAAVEHLRKALASLGETAAR